MATVSDPFVVAAGMAADIFDPPGDEDFDLAQRCATHLPTFIREAWPILEPATRYVHGWHVDTICEHLEAVTAGELPRLVINQPPRTMKSLTCGVCWIAWEWLSNPAIRWLCASYAADLSTRDSLKCRRLIESKGGRETGTIFQRIGYQGVLGLLTKHRWRLGPTYGIGADGKWSLTGDQNAKTKYETTATGMRLATSVGGVATGEGGDRILVDDPTSAKQARSEAERKAANTWWDETMTTRFNNAQAAAVIVMQRLHESDLTGHLIDSGDWHHLCLPGVYEPSHPFVYPNKVTLPERTYNVQAEDGSVEEVVVPGGRVLAGDPRTAEGELLEPVRLSEARLAELRKGLGSYGFAGQIQQRPSPEEGGMFKRDWWRYYDAALSRDDPMGRPDDWMFERIVASWDMRFSDSQSKASSYVVGQVWGRYKARFYLLGQVRAKLSFTDTVKAVLAVQERWPLISVVLIEKKANGEAVMSQLARRVTGMIPVEPEGGKDVRASAVQPNVEAGDLWLPSTEFIPCPPSVEPSEGEARLELAPTATADFVEEHAVFDAGAFDDQVDAMSQAITWLLKHGASGGAVARPKGGKPKDGRRSTEDLRTMKF